MEQEKQSEIGGWDDYISHSKFLKAEDLKSEDDEYVITGLQSYHDDDNGVKLRLILERNEHEIWFDLNKTNAGLLQKYSAGHRCQNRK